jgi:hypothetical protein
MKTHTQPTTFMRRQLIMLVCLVVSPSASVRAQGVAGKWSVMWDADIRFDHDTAIVKGRKPATVELTQRGDSVFGTWSGGVEPGGVALRGTFDGRTMRLTSGVNERTGTRDGQPMKMKVRWDVNGALQGAKLAGTLFIYIGDMPAAPRRWDGQRVP